MIKKFSIFSGNNTLKLIMQFNLFRIFLINSNEFEHLVYWYLQWMLYTKLHQKR